MDVETHSRYAQNGEVMVASAILLFFMLLLFIFLRTFAHLYICQRRRHPHPHPHLRRNTAGHFYSGPITTTAKPLELSILKLLPTFTYSSARHLPLQECAVCLSEFEDDDEGRVLPSCNHAFHSHCIDTWFRSHCTCPLCRAPVQTPKIGSAVTVSSDPILPLSVFGAQSESQPSCSTLPPPIACPRRPLELVDMAGIIVELPSATEKVRV